MSRLSHVDAQGKASMVDVSEKAATERLATAEAVIVLSEEAFNLVVAGEVKKGDVLATARIAGIMAAKKTSELIPLCHPLALSHAGVEFEALSDRHAFRIVASAKTTGQTGVEMEAITAASIAAVTIYDMVKAVDRTARIESIRLLTKSGGKSGDFASERPTEKIPAPRAAARPAKAAPSVLMHEAASPRSGGPSADREALRKFMAERHLRATEWARSAAVPVNQLYGFLSGRAREIPAPIAEKLAKVARASVDEMFGRKSAR
jgi:cyclic pyranopterin phosphate synthase